MEHLRQTPKLTGSSIPNWLETCHHTQTSMLSVFTSKTIWSKKTKRNLLCFETQVYPIFRPHSQRARHRILKGWWTHKSWMWLVQSFLETMIKGKQVLQAIQRSCLLFRAFQNRCHCQQNKKQIRSGGPWWRRTKKLWLEFSKGKKRKSLKTSFRRCAWFRRRRV